MDSFLRICVFMGTAMTFFPAHSLEVVCDQLKKNGERLSYTIAPAPSHRFQGNATLGTRSFPDFQLAQYKTSSRELFVMFDDPDSASYPVLKLEAYRYKKNSFLGKISQYQGPNKVSSIKVYCRVLDE